MAGTEDDVQRLLDAKAKREAEARAAVEAAEAKRRFQQAENERLQTEGFKKWPAIYQMLRRIFDVWQPSLDGLGLKSAIGGRPETARYMFKFERKDGRAWTALSFALSNDNRLNVAIEKFTDTGGMVRPATVPTFLAETEEAARPIFAAAIEELEGYERKAGILSRRYRPEKSTILP